MPSPVTGTGIVLTGDAVVVRVKPVRVLPGAALLEKEELRGALTLEIAAILIGCRGRRRQQERHGRQHRGDTEEKWGIEA
jgi:hypothetical protein